MIPDVVNKVPTITVKTSSKWQYAFMEFESVRPLLIYYVYYPFKLAPSNNGREVKRYGEMWGKTSEWDISTYLLCLLTILACSIKQRQRGNLGARGIASIEWS